jgi:hypothetical protein
MFTHQRIQGDAGAPIAKATLAICKAEGMTGHGETARLRLELDNGQGGNQGG